MRYLLALVSLMLSISCRKSPRQVTLFEKPKGAEMRVEDVVVRNLEGLYPTSHGRVSENATHIWYNVGGRSRLRPTLTGASTGDYYVDGGRWGVLKRIRSDLNVFEELTDPVFDTFLDFSEDLAAVSQEGRWGFIDTSGNMVVDCRFDTVPASHRPHDAKWYYGFRNGQAWVRQDGRSFRIDRKGRRMDERDYEIDPFYLIDCAGLDDPIPVYATWFRENGRWGVMDETAHTVVAPAFDAPMDFRSFRGDLVWMEHEGRWGLWDEKARQWKLIPQFDHVEVRDNLTWANVGGRLALLSVVEGSWALVDSLGSIAIPLGAAPDLVRSGIMPDHVDGKWGYWYDGRLNRAPRSLDYLLGSGL
jgi:hypothetical protein